MILRNLPHLIAYPDRMGSSISDLHKVMREHFPRCFGGVHLLPPFPSNADGGFSPLTHREIDPRYGSWEEVEALAAEYDLCLDLVLNHIADESPEFKDFLANGRDSRYAELFVDVDALGEITSDDLAKIHIRKEKEPFREVTLANGEKKRVWCTFTEKQVDLNYDAEATYDFMEENLRVMTGHGVKLFRLDAFGYTTKKIGTSCFLVEPDVYDILGWFHRTANRMGAEVLPEVHDHSSYQFAIGMRGMRPYGFALPPLLLYSLLDANSVHLKNWLRVCPRNQITVLDTHDGICIPDVEGILPADKIQAVIDNVSQRSADPILRRSAANVHSVGAIYQLTCTFYDALKQNDDAYIAARAIQLFAPGIPQIYYVGLLAGTNDEELMEHTGELRDINRTYFDLEAVAEATEKPVVRRLIQLLEFRCSHPAFRGTFELVYSNDTSVSMQWKNGDAKALLFVDLNFKKTTVRYRDERTGRMISRIF
ncbi:sucrose phosphorylase [Algiphilus aromaticivorans]|jgi:sucrose phosphorylase|uniref:sucrose phosphorylase n=1 Tax=Algiphilus aromaticivorans TaxID=382454 RepID=UPI0005C21BC8|nr:sucrose phosphorylase [Algiphilus aromaticivorans]